MLGEDWLTAGKAKEILLCSVLPQTFLRLSSVWGSGDLLALSCRSHRDIVPVAVADV